MWKTKKFQRLVLLSKEVLTGDGVRLRPLLAGAPCPVCGPNRRRLAFFTPSAAPTGGQEKENVPSSPARGEDEPIKQERQSALLRRAGRDFAQLLCSTPAARADGEQEATEPAGDGNPASPSARGEGGPAELERQSANRPPQGPLLTLRIRMQENEIYRCLLLGTRRAGPARRIAESVILGVMAVYCGAAYLLDEQKASASLLLALLSLAVLAAIWLVPPLRMRSAARQIAGQENEVFLSLYDKEAAFGKKNPKYIAYSSCRALLGEGLLVLEIGRELVGIPRRLTDPAGWSLLLEKFQPEDARPRRQRLLDPLDPASKDRRPRAEKPDDTRPSPPAHGEGEPIEQERQSALLRREKRDFTRPLCSTPAARAGGEQDAPGPAADGNPASPSARGEDGTAEQKRQSANRPPQETPSQGENLSTPARGQTGLIEQERQSANRPPQETPSQGGNLSTPARGQTGLIEQERQSANRPPQGQEPQERKEADGYAAEQNQSQ